MENNEELPSDIRNIILDDENDIFISIVSLWEIAIKYSLGKLKLSNCLEDFFKDIENEYYFKIISIKTKHILYQSDLSFIHKDPFDRLIYSTAKTENINFLYTDKIFDEYDINTD